MSLIDDIPPFYQKFMPDSVKRAYWSDSKKCSSCQKVCGEKPIYNKEVKCCTYYPFIPNYQVGEILTHNRVGAKKIKTWVANRQYTLPIGVCAPEVYQFEFQKKGKSGFGQSVELRCPFFENDQCQVWKQRTSECISFQCESLLSQRGLEFWKQLGDVIHKIEMYLSQELMLQMGFLWPEVELNLKMIKQETWQKESQDLYVMTENEFLKFWPHRRESIDLFYKECYKRALNMPVKEYLATLDEYICLKNLSL